MHKDIFSFYKHDLVIFQLVWKFSISKTDLYISQIRLAKKANTISKQSKFLLKTMKLDLQKWWVYFIVVKCNFHLRENLILVSTPSDIKIESVYLGSP